MDIKSFTNGVESTIHHLFLVLYSQNMYRDALIVGAQLKCKYPILEHNIPSIGYKGVDIVRISIKALEDVNSGEYEVVLHYFDSSSTIEFFSHLDEITKKLNTYEH